jgi:hypothetical protein
MVLIFISLLIFFLSFRRLLRSKDPFRLIVAVAVRNVVADAGIQDDNGLLGKIAFDQLIPQYW